MAIKTFPLTLEWAKMITPNVRHLAFSYEGGEKPFDFIPGQFITIHFTPDDKELRRSYSIATVPGQSNLIELALSYFAGGAASEYLFNLAPGTIIQASGPYGRLILREEDNPDRYIFVATGTGVTPYRSMLPSFHQRLDKNPHLKIILLLGVQSREHNLYEEEFLAFAKEHARFEFYVHYSRQSLSNPLPHERFGYVQNAFDTLELNPDKDLIYLCGNPNMIDNAVEIVKNIGFQIQQLRREKYVS